MVLGLHYFGIRVGMFLRRQGDRHAVCRGYLRVKKGCMQNKKPLELGKDKEVLDKEECYFGRSSYMKRKSQVQPDIGTEQKMKWP
jgi:hypothetical protein